MCVKLLGPQPWEAWSSGGGGWARQAPGEGGAGEPRGGGRAGEPRAYRSIEHPASAFLDCGLLLSQHVGAGVHRSTVSLHAGLCSILLLTLTSRCFMSASGFRFAKH